MRNALSIFASSRYILHCSLSLSLSLSLFFSRDLQLIRPSNGVLELEYVVIQYTANDRWNNVPKIGPKFITQIGDEDEVDGSPPPLHEITPVTEVGNFGKS